VAGRTGPARTSCSHIAHVSHGKQFAEKIDIHGESHPQRPFIGVVEMQAFLSDGIRR
jgi:hypothetical protein